MKVFFGRPDFMGRYCSASAMMRHPSISTAELVNPSSGTDSPSGGDELEDEESCSSGGGAVGRLFPPLNRRIADPVSV